MFYRRPTSCSRAAATVHAALVVGLGLTCVNARAQQCADNFISSGSTWRGYTYETQAVVPGAHPIVVFAAVATHMATEGWRVTESDPDTGVLSALQPVRGRPGQTAPVRAVILPLEAGVSVSLHLSIDGAAGRRADDVLDSFCRLLNAVGVDADTRTHGTGQGLATPLAYVLRHNVRRGGAIKWIHNLQGRSA